MEFVSHPLVKENAIQRRLYQETILGTCVNRNSLVILPTGLGKTIIAVLIAISRLSKYPNSKIIFLAPTKPLAAQHYQTFKAVLTLDEGLQLLTGSIPSEKRAELLKTAKILFYTPQTLQNDLITGIGNLQEVSFVIFDEAHRAVGEYAYTFIADQYMKTGVHPLILGMTASPGATQEKINTVIENLFIQNIEIRTEKSPDVIRYVQPIEMHWDRIELPTEFREVKQLIETEYKNILKLLKRYEFLESYDVSRVTKQDLLKAQMQIQKSVKSQPNPSGEDFELIANVAMAVRFSYMLELLETQGLNSLLAYFTKMEKSVAGKHASRLLREFINSPFFVDIKKKVTGLLEKGLDHPKFKMLKKHLLQQFAKSKASRVIVFTQYRVTAQLITDQLAIIEGLKPVRFVGQQSKPGDKGLDQKRQIGILQEFREGLYNVLVATSVAEEGLDIAECDLVIFYDVVPSEIRYVQRRGRTGRKRPGGVIILMAQGTRDEGYYWAARRKQGEMYRILGEVQEIYRKKFRSLDENQTHLDKFVSREQPMEYEIIVDHREKSSTLVKELVSSGFKINLEQLAVADYVIGNRIYIERKTCQDFSKSIIDGRLFKEISELKQNAPHSLLVVEGEDLYTASTLRPEAIRAAFISIMIDFNMPIIWSKSGKETAAFFTTIARREMEHAQGKKTVRTRIEKAPDKTSEVQEYIVAGLPGIDTIRAKNLLRNFQTVEKVFTAVEEELVETEGIGKKLAERIRKILTEPYKA